MAVLRTSRGILRPNTAGACGRKRNECRGRKLSPDVPDEFDLLRIRGRNVNQATQLSVGSTQPASAFVGKPHQESGREVLRARPATAGAPSALADKTSPTRSQFGRPKRTEHPLLVGAPSRNRGPAAVRRPKSAHPRFRSTVDVIEPPQDDGDSVIDYMPTASGLFRPIRGPRPQSAHLPSAHRFNDARREGEKPVFDEAVRVRLEDEPQDHVLVDDAADFSEDSVAHEIPEEVEGFPPRRTKFLSSTSNTDDAEASARANTMNVSAQPRTKARRPHSADPRLLFYRDRQPFDDHDAAKISSQGQVVREPLRSTLPLNFYGEDAAGSAQHEYDVGEVEGPPELLNASEFHSKEAAAPPPPRPTTPSTCSGPAISVASSLRGDSRHYLPPGMIRPETDAPEVDVNVYPFRHDPSVADRRCHPSYHGNILTEYKKHQNATYCQAVQVPAQHTREDLRRIRRQRRERQREAEATSAALQERILRERRELLAAGPPPVPEKFKNGAGKIEIHPDDLRELDRKGDSSSSCSTASSYVSRGPIRYTKDRPPLYDKYRFYSNHIMRDVALGRPPQDGVRTLDENYDLDYFRRQNGGDLPEQGEVGNATDYKRNMKFYWDTRSTNSEARAPERRKRKICLSKRDAFGASFSKAAYPRCYVQMEQDPLPSAAPRVFPRKHVPFEALFKNRVHIKRPPYG